MVKCPQGIIETAVLRKYIIILVGCWKQTMQAIASSSESSDSSESLFMEGLLCPAAAPVAAACSIVSEVLDIVVHAINVQWW